MFPATADQQASVQGGHWRPATPWAVVAGAGPIDATPYLMHLLAGAGAIIAADSAADRLAVIGVSPTLVVGDMDSIAPATLVRLQKAGSAVAAFDPRKDFTDGELALDIAVRQGWQTIVLAGWFGGARLDHSLANQLILAHPNLASAMIAIVIDGGIAHVVHDELELAGAAGDIVSLLPLTARVDYVVTSGLDYPLAGETLWLHEARGVSNVMQGERATVGVRSGALLVFHLDREVA